MYLCARGFLSWGFYSAISYRKQRDYIVFIGFANSDECSGRIDRGVARSMRMPHELRSLKNPRCLVYGQGISW